MGCAPMSYVLWKDFMTVDPKVGGTDGAGAAAHQEQGRPAGLHCALWCAAWYQSQPRNAPP